MEKLTLEIDKDLATILLALVTSSDHEMISGLDVLVSDPQERERLEALKAKFIKQVRDYHKKISDEKSDKK